MQGRTKKRPMWNQKKKEPVTFYVRILYDLFLWLAWPLFSLNNVMERAGENVARDEVRLQELREQGVRRRKKEEETFFFRSCLLFALKKHCHDDYDGDGRQWQQAARRQH